MSQFSNLSHWKNILRQQKEKNLRQWLTDLTHTEAPADFLANHYEHLLQALESALGDEACFDLAFELVQNIYFRGVSYGDEVRWQAYMRQLLAMSEGLGRLAEQGQLLEQLGNLERQLGNYELANDCFERGVALYAALGDPGREAKLLLKKAQLKTFQGDLPQAWLLYRQSLQLLGGVPAGASWAFAHLTASTLYYKARSHDQAAHEAQQAITLYTQLGDPLRANVARLNLIRALVALRRWNELNQLSPHVIAHLEAEKNLGGLIRVHISLGIAAYEQANYRLAEQHWQLSYNFSLQSQEKESFAAVCNNLGKAYTALKEWEMSEKMLIQALDFYRFIGDHFNQANTLDNFADLYEAKGDHAQLATVLEHGLVILENIVRSNREEKLWQTMKQRQAQIMAGGS